MSVWLFNTCIELVGFTVHRRACLTLPNEPLFTNRRPQAQKRPTHAIRCLCLEARRSGQLVSLYVFTLSLCVQDASAKIGQNRQGSDDLVKYSEGVYCVAYC